MNHSRTYVNNTVYVCNGWWGGAEGEKKENLKTLREREREGEGEKDLSWFFFLLFVFYFFQIKKIDKQGRHQV